MNWETYKQMSLEQREEYDFKYSETPSLGLNYPVMLYLVLTSTISSMIFGIYLILTEDKFIDSRTKIDIVELFFSWNVLTVVTMWILVTTLLGDIFKMFLHFYKKKKWLKKNNIKSIYNFKFWEE